eukprot:6483682-Amphidinium_carterae.1
MKLPSDSYERAASIRLEPCARIQLLMHYARILPPPPVELKRCQEYFISPPSNVTKPNLGFTTILKGIVESHHAFRAKYQFHAMALNTMTVTTEEI